MVLLELRRRALRFRPATPGTLTRTGLPVELPYPRGMAVEGSVIPGYPR
jgi:hypothetical protein